MVDEIDKVISMFLKRQEPVVRKADNTIHRIVIFSTAPQLKGIKGNDTRDVKLAKDKK